MLKTNGGHFYCICVSNSCFCYCCIFSVGSFGHCPRAFFVHVLYLPPVLLDTLSPGAYPVVHAASKTLDFTSLPLGPEFGPLDT